MPEKIQSIWILTLDGYTSSQSDGKQLQKRQKSWIELSALKDTNTAFELLPQTFEQLLENCALNAAVRTLQVRLIPHGLNEHAKSWPQP